MNQEVPAPLYQELFALAKSLQTLAPWEAFSDEHVFAVVIPDTGEKCYCSILGALGEMMGMVVYRGAQGLRCFKELKDESDEDVDLSEVGLKQNGILFSLAEWDDLDPEMLGFYRKFGFKKSDRWIPIFQTYVPGFVPAAIGHEDAQTLQVVFGQAIQVCMDALTDPEVFSQLGFHEGKDMLMRVFEGGKWQYAHLPHDPVVELSPFQLTLRPEHKPALLNLPIEEAAWLFEHFYLNIPLLDEETGRGMYPKVVLVMELTDAKIHNSEAARPDQWQSMAYEVIVEAIQKLGFRPAQMVVANRENYILLKQLCKSLEIELYLEKEANMVAELRDMVMGTFTDMDDEDGELDLEEN